jgi:hypothetical protein
MVRAEFSYTDEFGQESHVVKTFTEDYIESIGSFYMLIEEFKLFLAMAGYTRDLVDQIQIVED